MPDTLNIYVFKDTTAAIAPTDTIKSLTSQLGFNYTAEGKGAQINDSLQPYSGAFFKEHQLRIKNGLKEVPMPSSVNASYLLLLASLLILVFLKNLGNEALMAYFVKTPASDRRERHAFNSVVDWLHSLNALIAYTTFIYLLAGKFILNYYPTLSVTRLIFLIILPGLLFYLQLKKGFMAFLGSIFRTRPFTQSLIFEENRFMRMTGLLIIPFLLISAIGNGNIAEISLLISLFIILLLYLRKIFIWTLMSFKNIHILGIYFFLYLCTVEILPLALLAKLVTISW